MIIKLPFGEGSSTNIYPQNVYAISCSVWMSQLHVSNLSLTLWFCDSIYKYLGEIKAQRKNAMVYLL